MKTIVLGAGIAGLASAVRASMRGEDVVVIEASETYGGKLGESTIEGFRFDTGPSLFTLPELVEELFAVAQQPCTLQYKQLHEICNYFWQDGTTLRASADIDQLDQTFATSLGATPGSVAAYLQKSAKTYNLTKSSFLESSLHETSTWFSKPFLQALARIGKLPLRRTLHQFNKDRLKAERAVQLFDRYATYNGSNPFKAPSMLSVIPHLEFTLGTYFPVKGMRSIAKSIYTLACDLGVQFEFNTRVTRLPVESKHVHSIETDRGTFAADLVISAIDCHHFYKLARLRSHKRYQRTLKDRSTSAIVFFWGMNGSHPQLDTHNIIFSKNYQTEFEQLSKSDAVPDDPTIYIHISSKQNQSDAPHGQENWFVMVNTGSSSIDDWRVHVDTTRERVKETIRETLGIDVDSLLKAEEVMDPHNIEVNTGSYTGSLYGNASNSSMSAFFRHPNRTADFRNVYFVGGSVHPGGGIPLCLLSARIVDDLIKKHG